MDGLTAKTRVGELKEKISEITGKSEDDLVLIYKDNELSDSRTLGYYNIKDNSVIEVEN